MSDRLERIRRVLADHGPAVRRAADLPPAPATPAPSGAPAPPTARDLLRARLAALQAQRGAAAGPGAQAWAGGAPPPALPPEDGTTLEAKTGAALRTGPHGGYLLVERRWALTSRQGEVPLAEAFSRVLPLRRRERRAAGRPAVDPRDAVFLDVETTGLSGGTGTVAFLIGAGRLEGDAFVVRQYFLRDFPDEGAVLEALAQDLGDAPLITFNGRCFDAPLLATRFRLHRVPWRDRDHLDLLPPARRLWAGSLASHALGEIERHVLRVERTEDLPGALLPAAYFAWLREGASAGVALAFRHNESDIVSLAALAGVVGRLLEDPAARRAAPARDHLETARWLVDLGDLAKARACLEAALGADAPATAAPLRRLLGDLHRRAGDLVAAEATWRRWMAAPGPPDPHPYVELAKVFEHRRRDPLAALDLVAQALTRCDLAPGPRGALEHRAERLRRKSAARRPPDPR